MRHNIDVIIAGVYDNTGAVIVWGFGNNYGSTLPDISNVRRRRDSLVSVSAFSQSIEDDRSVATSGVTTITLPADDGSVLGYRPIDIFSRIGAESLAAADVWSTQGLTAGATEIVMRNDGGVSTSYTGTLLLHIGTECIGVTSPNPIGTGWQTCTITRGMKQTTAHPHRALGSGFLARTIPVTKYPVTWIGREVLVYVDGHLFRRMFLVDNPVVTKNQVVLQAVGVENKLTVQRSSSYTPTYATTLAADDYQAVWRQGREWAPIFVRDHISVPVSFSTNPIYWRTFVSSRAISGIYAPDGNAIRQLAPFGTQTTDLLPDRYMPTIALTFSGETNVGQVAAAELSAPGRWTGAITATQAWDRLQWYPSVSLNAASTAGDDRARLAYVTFGAGTWWNIGEGVGYNDGDYGAPTIWNTGGQPAPYCVGWFGNDVPGDAVLLMKPRFAQRNGFSTPIGSKMRAGMIWRRNAAPDEETWQIADTDPFAGLPAWLDYTGGERPKPDAATACLTYPVRPNSDYMLTSGGVHNQSAHNGCVLDVLVFGYLDDSTPVGPRVTIANTFWEQGQSRVLLLQEIPLAANGAASIKWVEPDGTELEASCTLVRDTAHDSGGYCYRISDVRMKGTSSPVVGFGNWPNQPQCQITRPVECRCTATEGLDYLIAAVIASGDGSSGRLGDDLGDGLDVVLTVGGAASINLTPALTAAYMFAPSDDQTFNQFLETALLLCNSIVVGAIDQFGDYGPVAKPASAPMAIEIKRSITDDEIIGVPSTSGAGGQIFTGYKIDAGTGVTWTFVDWLAADLLGTGDIREINLAPMLQNPKEVTQTGAAHIVDALRDRFGTLRRRWSMTVPIETAMDLAPGDVVDVTSQHLVAGAGGLGVTQEMARLTSVSLDFRAGTADLEMLAWASYGTGWNASFDVRSLGYDPNYTYLELLVDTPRQQVDALFVNRLVVGDLFYFYVLYGTAAPAGTRITLTYQGKQDAQTLRFSRNTTATSGLRGVLMPLNVSGWFGQCFQVDRDRLQ